MVASSHKIERKKERILIWVLLVSKDHSCTVSDDQMAEEEEEEEEGIAAAAAR
jgi:hypothetical protein